MSRWHSYLNTAAQFLRDYNGDEPFSSFLKKQFAQEKKYGSKDRKWIGHLCYCYFRTGKALSGMPVQQRILTTLFLCSSQPNEALDTLMPDWSEATRLTVQQKWKMIGSAWSMEAIFPWKDELSDGVEQLHFSASFLQQPYLFLRLRPGNEELVKKKLKQAELSFTSINDNCLALDNSSRVDTVLALDKGAVVQDLSSQQTGEVFRQSRAGTGKIRVWDCCAASGGKSIMAYDINPGIVLTVSDVRESILANLKKRFSAAGIKKYESFIADLSVPSTGISHPPFPMIIADLPCTGSGTWSRTPEQLYYFDTKKIDEYAALQKKIMRNIVPQLLPGGQLLYITCSVFRKENEEVVEFV